MKLNLTSCAYSYKLHLYNLKTHSSVFIDLENKITGPCTSVSSHKRIKSFYLIIISREFITFMHLSSDDYDKPNSHSLANDIHLLHSQVKNVLVLEVSVNK